MFARPAVADENAGAAVFGRVRDALHGPKDSGLAGIQPQLGGNAGGKSGFGGGAQQLTARKALGNITNARGPAAAGGSSLLLGKPTAAQQQQQELKGAPPRGPQPPPRRAFGDLTNSLGGAKQALGASSLPKPVSSQQQQQQPGSQAVVAAQQELPRHEAYAADGGVERMAGKGWRQMEAERLAAQDIAINRRVSMVTSTMASAWASSPNQFLPVRPDSESDLEEQAGRSRSRFHEPPQQPQQQPQRQPQQQRQPQADSGRPSASLGSRSGSGASASGSGSLLSIDALALLPDIVISVPQVELALDV